MNKPPRLLLVDDEALNREVALDQLKELGLAADVAVDGEGAVAMAAATDYDLILMDIQMPVMDGHEASRRILALPERQKTPIIALTANVLPENRSACLAAGMVDYLEKPVSTQRLRTCLGRWLPAVGAAPPPATGNGQWLLIALEAAGGFAPAVAVDRLGIKIEKYPLLLSKYLEVHGQTVTQAGAALQAGDLLLARRLVHTLKGTAATLGLEATHNAAARLDKMLVAAGDEQAVGALYRELAETDRQQRATLHRLLTTAAG
jgi:CheY-like chemotaxis protein/HPt (histidine-containing phosphotransfer) domain-containing protein